jgi:anti-sigma factor RsiW
MSEHIYLHEEHKHCQDLLLSLGEYVDGTLSQDLCSILERHLKDCQRCRIVLNTLKKTVELYQETAEDATMPDEVRQRLYQKLNLDDYLK